MRSEFNHSFIVITLLLAFVAPMSLAEDNKEERLSRREKSSCSDLLSRHRPFKYRFGKLGTIESLDFGHISTSRLSLALLFGQSILKVKALPTTKEVKALLLKKVTSGISTPEEYSEKFGEEATKAIPIEIWNALNDSGNLFYGNPLFESLESLVASVKQAYPHQFAILESEIQLQAFKFFRHRLVPPSFEQLGEILRFEDLELLELITKQPQFWEQALFSDTGRHVDYARKRIKTAYARAVRGTDTPAVHRTRKIHPEIRRITEELVLTKSNEHFQWRAYTGDYGKYDLFDEDLNPDEKQFELMMRGFSKELEAMLGQRKLTLKVKDPIKKWAFPMPVLFPGGYDELHGSTRAEYQATFTSFEDKKKFPNEYANHVRGLIAESPGIMVSTIIPGLKVDWDLLDGMIKMSKESQRPIILIPADGMLQDLDERVLNHPDLHILTTSIENSELLLALYPSNMRSEPLTPFKKAGMFKMGQQIIVPHHILKHESIPTAHNSINQTQIFSTGIINIPQVPSVGKNQKAKAFRVSKEMKRSFLVVDKIDKGESQDFGGVKNHWHIRPVEYRSNYKSLAGVFVDQNQAYEIHKIGSGPDRVQVLKSKAVQIYLPDIHFVTSDPRIMSAIKKQIDFLTVSGIRVTLILPDPIDSKAINAHVEKKQMNRDALHKLLESGELNFEDEINDAISNINVLLNELPQVEVVFQYSNHSDDWIDRDLINGPSWLQLVANGPFIDEMRVASRMNGWTPLEYLMLHREKFLRRLSVDGSDRYKNKAVFVSDTSRVRTMRRGEPLSTGMDAWEVYSQHHGHQGANGGRSSFKTHGLGEIRSITGDAHRSGFEGRGEINFWMGVGSTSWEQPYTQGGYTSWAVSLAVVSAYNTMQLIQMDPYSGSFFQRAEIGPLSPKDFFGEDPLLVAESMDDDELRKDIDHNEFMNWLITQTKLFTSLTFSESPEDKE